MDTKQIQVMATEIYRGDRTGMIFQIPMVGPKGAFHVPDTARKQTLAAAAELSASGL
jgi:hypothetical protein